MESKDAGFSLPWKVLENETLKLTPFHTERHAPIFFNGTKDHPETYEHMFIGPYETDDQFENQFLRGTMECNPNAICLAIIDKTSPPSTADSDGQLAGLVACTEASIEHQTVSIGYLILLPAFRSSAAFATVFGLLLHYFLQSPSEGGLGLRRVEAITSRENHACVIAMQQLGLRKEGERRWHRLFVDGERRGKIGNGRSMPAHGNGSHLGRDTVNFAMCWDDWLEGGREKVRARVNAKKRKQASKL